MKRVKSYISGVIVASVLFYVPFIKKWKITEREMNDNGSNDKKTFHKEANSLNTIKMDVAIKNDEHTCYGSKLFGKQVLFHKITDHADFTFQKYAFAGNIINVYYNKENKIAFDVQIFMQPDYLTSKEISRISRKDITKDLILKGFVRSELLLA